MDTNTFGIPVGPVNSEPTEAYHTRGGFKDTQSKEAILRDTLMRRGVELGSEDEAMILWLSQSGWGTFATITSWIERAR